MSIKKLARTLGVQAMIEDEGDQTLNYVSAVLYDHKEDLVNGCTVSSLSDTIAKLNENSVGSFRRLFIFADSDKSDKFDVVMYSYRNPQI